MANTFTAIATTNVGSGGTSTITFSSIPQTFNDLVVLMSIRSTSGNTNATQMAVNGDTTSGNYSAIVLENAGGAAGFIPTPQYFVGTFQPPNYTANIFSSHKVHIPSYTNARRKTWIGESAAENNATTGVADAFGVRWNNTAAITSLTFTLATGNFAEFSSITLYGISNV